MNTHSRWLSRYATARRLLITAGCCFLVHWIVAGLALFPYFLEAGPDSWGLRAEHVMTDYYEEALLLTLLAAGVYLWRGGATRRAHTLLIGMSVVWWLVMLGVRLLFVMRGQPTF